MKGLSILILLVIFINATAQKTIATNQNDSCPVITGFKIFNDALSIDSILSLQRIELSPDQNVITISFAFADTTIKHDAVYYKLEGADKDWIKAGSTATVSYTLLPPGGYDFKLKCNEHIQTTALRLLIKVPFWLSSWFIISCCATFIGGAYWLHSLSIKRILAVEAVRQKVSRDLHDDIGSALSTINILSTMAKSKLMDEPAKATEYISKISESSSKMMEAMDDIVWSINPMNDSMQKVFARMREFAGEVLESKDIEVKLHFDEGANDVALNMEQRRDIFLIFKEAVNNIAKYANATDVNIDVRLKDRLLSLIIKDNGIGFILQNADSGNGLNNMRDRAEKLKARFNISSETNNGTEIKLEMQTT